MKRNQPAGQEVDVIPQTSQSNPTLALEGVEVNGSPESPIRRVEDPTLQDLAICFNEDLDWLLSDEHDMQWGDLTPPAATGVVGEWLSQSDHSVDMSTVDPSLLCMREPSIPPTPQDPFDQYLFTYYMETLSLRLYPVKSKQNPYRTIYGALATESEPLLRSTMLASALHLSKQGKLPRFAVKPYRMAVQASLHEALKTQNEAWSLGVTVLLSVVSDIIDTGLDTWSSKLIGCRRLLIDKLASQGSLGEGLEMASHQSHWWDDLPDYQMHLFLREATEYSLNIARLSTAGQTNEALRLMPQVAELVNRIKQWHPAVPTVQSEFVDSIQYFQSICRIGMLCFVYSEIYALGPNDDLIKDLVDASIEPLEKLSWLQACLFPLFMVALHAQTDKARSSFEAKLTDMHTVLGFQGPLSVISILKNVWQQTNATLKGRVQWREVIRNLGAEINILL
ncbi:hypothetical protein AnigIFM62618_005425 [Aspergillus niger]|nr:hypothetical protein AnigIFM62618_005425 [Aspergillus niger]